MKNCILALTLLFLSSATQAFGAYDPSFPYTCTWCEDTSGNQTKINCKDAFPPVGKKITMGTSVVYQFSGPIRCTNEMAMQFCTWVGCIQATNKLPDPSECAKQSGAARLSCTNLVTGYSSLPPTQQMPSMPMMY